MTKDARITTVETDVGRLHVETTGSGPTVLCWPSLFCDGRTMAEQVAELATDHRVVVVDGPGHGRSTAPRDFSFDDCADAAMRVLDAAEAPRAVWVGSAWGGHVGALTALRHPKRLRALVTMNAPMHAWSGGQRAKLWSMFQVLRLFGPRDFLVKAVTHAQLSEAVRTAHPERVAAIEDCIRSSDRRGFVRAVRSAMLGRSSMVERLGEIRVPTLFITGALDSLFPVAMARGQAERIPGCRFEVIEGTAHQSAYEAPEKVNPLIRAFLGSLPADG